MHRSLLQSFFAICATAALLLQHAPLAWIGGDGHFCTDQYCVCGNPHHHGEGHHHAAAHGASPLALGNSEGVRGDIGDSGAVHRDHHRSPNTHGSNVQDSSHSGPVTASRAAFQPCDSDPAGIVTLTLDKFVPRLVADLQPAGIEASPSSSYTDLHDQLVIQQIFRPPVSTPTRIG